MSLSLADEHGLYIYRLSYFPSVRLFVLLVFCLFGVYRYVLRTVKYRVSGPRQSAVLNFGETVETLASERH